LKDCPCGAVFLAAVSGGADSMALLTALSVLVPLERLFCLHVEHGLRSEEECRLDAEFVRDFCGKRGINCRVESIPQGKIASFARRRKTGIEAAARFFRRRALIQEARRIACQNGLEENVLILTAHTKDDMLETVLMRLLRGAGPAGLAAMPVRRGKFLRPLLSMSRADVTGYLKEKNVSWREDSSNSDEKFLRNKIRRNLVPLLDGLFPDWKKGVTGMAQTQSLVAEFFNRKARKCITWENETGAIVTNEENFFAQSKVIREEALFQGIDSFCASASLHGELPSHSIKRSVVRRFCDGSVKASDFGPLKVRRRDGKVALSGKKNEFSESGFSLLIKEPGLYNLNSINIEAGLCSENGNSIFLVTVKEPGIGGVDV
jgi:tRNA(Ile)-lysidine synthase